MKLTAQQTPTFQSRVDVIPVDVTVVDGRGQPLQDLAVSEFTVRIDGQPRRVISAEWVPLSTGAAVAPAARVPAGYTSNETNAGAGGRLIVLAIDQPSIPFTAARPLQDTLNGFVDRFSPSDRIAVVGFGQGAPSISFTADRERIKQAIARMPGQQRSAFSRHQLGLAPAMAISGDGGIDRDRCAPRCSNPALTVVVERDCPADDPARPGEREICRQEIVSEARSIAVSARQETDATMTALRQLLNGLKGLDAPKTLVFLSQRLFLDPQRDDVLRVNELGALALAARTSIYTVRLQEDGTDISRAIQSDAPGGDRLLEQQGLESLALAARGALFNVAGTGSGVFDRITAELSGYYLLGVEPSANDRDGKSHPIAVDIMRRGFTVRTRRTILAGGAAAPAGAPAASARATATAALASPLPFSSLPMRGIAFVLRGSDPARLQLLLHADIGSGYTAPTRLTVAYVVADKDGRPVEGQVSESRLSPAVSGLPSPIEFTGGGSVPPGDYTLKVAAVDGDRTGTLEMPLHAALVDAGPMRLTELMAGGPVPPGDLLRPTIGARVSFGTVHGYLEAYGAGADEVTVTFEVAAADDGPALLSADVPGRKAGDDRSLFSQMIVVQSLPAGEYRLRAKVARNGTPIATLRRAFEIGAAAGAPASTAVSPAPSAAPVDLALAVEAKDLTPPFRRDEALGPATVAAFRERMTAAARPAFDQGLALLQKGNYADAETSFRLAQRQDPDHVASLVYLAACLAAAGYDTEAANAWQTALARGDEHAETYAWLGESLMRTRVFADARGIFEDAVARFPADTRLARSLALLYATSGKGRDAVRTMERFLADHPDDTRAHFLVVQWLFNLHRGGAVVHDRAADLQLARTSADRYLKSNPADQSLVKQWLEYLEKEK